MILRLTTDQIPYHWEAIKDMVKRYMPNVSDRLAEKNNNLLRSLLIGNSVCWIGYKKIAEKQNEIQSMLITRFIYDDLMDFKSLLLYCFTSWNFTEPNFYADTLETLKKYGKASDCSYVVFYSNNPSIISMAKKCGFDTSVCYGSCQI